jgi:hypothetical protein
MTRTLSQNPGQVATNTFTRYEPNSPVNVNKTVQRVPAQDWKDRFDRQLTQIPIIFGKPTAPVLTLHGLGDMVVPFSMEEDYAADMARHDGQGLVVQRAIHTAQHCVSPSEVGTAWDDLTRWVRDEVRPAGDDVAHPAAVAAATFGCQFSDRAAYAAAAGTHRLFAACR